MHSLRVWVCSLTSLWGSRHVAIQRRLEAYRLCSHGSNDLLEIWYLFMAYSMEHPAEPQHLDCAPSVWKLPEAGWLLAFPDVCKHLVKQGWFGALSSKPKTFLTHALASFPACLDAWWDRSVDPRSWITLIGRDEHGQYRTAQAKAYPSRLNAAIIGGVC